MSGVSAFLAPLLPLPTALSNSWDTVQAWLRRDLVALPCPHCSSYIEKAGGCDHMTCTTCKYEFCWKCLQAYDSHSEDLCFWHGVVLRCWLALPLLLLCVKLMCRTPLLELGSCLDFASVGVWAGIYFGKILPDAILHIREQEALSRWQEAEVKGLVGVAAVLWVQRALLGRLIVLSVATIGVNAPLIGVLCQRLTERI